MTKLKVTIDGKEHIVDSCQVEAYTEPKRGLFKPKMGEKYWFWSHFAGGPARVTWDGISDRQNYLNNDCCPTEEACMRGQKRKEVLKRMEDIAAEGEPIDWNDPEQAKYFIWYDNMCKKTGMSCASDLRFTGGVYFPTVELGRKCIKELGDDLLLVLEG